MTDGNHYGNHISALYKSTFISEEWQVPDGCHMGGA